MSDTRERLLQLAPLLWGSGQWQTAMTRELKVSRRTLSRYVHGKPVPALLMRELEAALLERLEAIVEALEVPEPLKGEVRAAVDAIREHRATWRKERPVNAKQ